MANRLTNLIRAIGAAIVLLIVNSLYTILLKFSANKHGHYDYNTRTVVMFSELMKLAMSAAMMSCQKCRTDQEQHKGFSWKSFALFAVPGFLYFVNNNVPFYCLMYVDAGSYHVLLQLKVLTTAIAFRLMMGKTMSYRKWGSLILLCVGCAVSQFKGSIQETLSQPVFGYVLIILQCTLSAIAAVYSEHLLKNTGQSIHLQNFQLYLFGVGFCLTGLFLEGLTNPFQWSRGYNLPASFAVLNLSFVGLMTSAVMKYADNIIKLFALAGSMFLVMAVSTIYFSVPLTSQLLVGGAIACASFYLYTVEPANTPGADGSGKEKGTDNLRTPLLPLVASQAHEKR